MIGCIICREQALVQYEGIANDNLGGEIEFRNYVCAHHWREAQLGHRYGTGAYIYFGKRIAGNGHITNLQVPDQSHEVTP